MKKLLGILFCIGIIFCLASCQQNNNDSNVDKPVITEHWEDKLLKSDPSGVKYDYYFESVEALLDAIKHDPDMYDGKKVKVVGTLHMSIDSEYDGRLVDFVADSTNLPPSEDRLTGDGLRARIELRKALNGATHKIYIDIYKDAQYAVAEDGDYVKIYGTITLDRDSIYIDDCEYDLIATLDERRENITKYKNPTKEN